MALSVKNYELPDNTVLEEVYVRIQKITTSNGDYEYFENVGDDQVLSWITRLDNIFTVYVWADEHARKNRTTAIHWFHGVFDYDLSSAENIYSQAYNSVRKYLEETYDDIKDC